LPSARIVIDLTDLRCLIVPGTLTLTPTLKLTLHPELIPNLDLFPGTK